MAMENGKLTQEWRLLDVSANPITEYVGLPFAVEEMECEQVGAGVGPLLHLWRHNQALVLGLRDRRLPYAKAAMEGFRREGWSVAVRNSGGAAVPLDGGVVNVSMVMPNRPGVVSIHQDFAAMAGLIAEAVRSVSRHADVRSGEISGAYCPGEYDLSIGGVKFCGIAQRRRLGAFVVQAFIVVEGSGAKRAEAAARFYRSAAGGSNAPNALRVTEQSTRSLEELLGMRISAEQFAEAVIQAAFGAATVGKSYSYDRYDQARLQAVMQTMKARYDTDG